MGLIWKLLRQHISVLQLAGFFVANLMGMLIVLLAMQFYQDLGPVFTSEDSFIHDDYLIASKRISMMGGLTGGETSSFTSGEIEDVRKQSFVNNVAGFVASQYKVACYVGIGNVEQFGTEMFFEAVPDEFVDTDRSEWKWSEGQEEIPIILPRTYLAIYNFGFAQSHSLPKMNEGVVSQIGMTVVLRGHGMEERMKGRVIGFSSRLNTILVPMDFMLWSNGRFAPDADTSPTRLIMSVANPTDSAITTYMKEHGYEIEEDCQRCDHECRPADFHTELLYPDAEHISAGAEEYNETAEPVAAWLYYSTCVPTLSTSDGIHECCGIADCTVYLVCSERMVYAYAVGNVS